MRKVIPSVGWSMQVIATMLFATTIVFGELRVAHAAIKLPRIETTDTCTGTAKPCATTTKACPDLLGCSDNSAEPEKCKCQ
jgi:hypothetical protein